MNLIQAVPDAPYFIWQLYIQMLNFRDYGKEKDAVILVAVNGQPSAKMQAFEKWTKATVHYFSDERKSRVYAPSIRPHLFKKYFRDIAQPAAFFYHDQDIIFLEQPALGELANDDVCYVAGKPSAPNEDYLSSKYCKKFGNGIFEQMCHITGVNPAFVEANDAGCGGAQYVIKSVDWQWWEKVEDDCEKLYQYLLTATQKDRDSARYHIQIWTSDMWAVLYNLWLAGKETKKSDAIDFCFPYEKLQAAKPVMHNAGIVASNQNDAAGNPLYFNKSVYNGDSFPFGASFDYVPLDCCQRPYVELLHRVTRQLRVHDLPRRKILGILCTTNLIHSGLLNTVIANINKAAANTVSCDVKIITVSWNVIPGNPFEGYITPFKGLGHLNYILQLKQALLQNHADIVCILEHDVLYPDNYFEDVIANWDYSKYGVCNNNYIGMNETGYLDVKERHQPFSLMSMAKFFLEKILDEKVNECVKNIGKGTEGRGFGWCNVEPDDKSLFTFIAFTNYKPAIHVNMNHLGSYGTGNEGKNHHFTSHCEVCYDKQSNGKVYRADWGDFRDYFAFA